MEKARQNYNHGVRGCRRIGVSAYASPERNHAQHGNLMSALTREIFRLISRYRGWRFEPMKAFDSVNNNGTKPAEREDPDNYETQCGKIFIERSDEIPRSSTQVQLVFD